LLQIVGQFEGGKEPQLANYGKQLKKLKAKSKAFSVDVQFDADLKSGNVDIPAFSLQTLGFTVSAKLNAKDMNSDNGSVNGNLVIEGENIKSVFAALGQQPLSEVLQSIKINVGINGNRKNLVLKPLSVNAILSGKDIPNSPVNVAVNADTNVNLDDEKLNLESFVITGLGLNIKGQLSASNIMQSPKAIGKLEIAPFDLRTLMSQLNQKLPVTADKKVFKKMALVTRFKSSDNSLSLDDLVLRLDDTKLDGNLSINNFEQPAISFNIIVDTLNADRYLPPTQKGKKKKPVTPEAAATAAVQLPIETLKALNIQGNMAIGKLTISNAKLSNIKLSLNGKDGKIKLDPVTADLYQGTYSGKIHLNATGKFPRLTINSALKGIQVEPLLKDLTGEAKLRGTGDFSAALIAAGADTDTMKKTLNGQMGFNFRNGAIKGFNLGKIMRQANSLKDSFTLKVSKNEETDLSEITGNPVATNGVIRLDDLIGKSPGLRLSGNGVLADLSRNSINYKVTAQLVATSTGQDGKELQEGKLEGVPLDCYFKGKLDSPKRDCDASKLIAALGLKAIQKLLKLPTKVIPGGKTPATNANTDTKAEQQQIPQESGDPLEELKKKLLEKVFDF